MASTPTFILWNTNENIHIRTFEEDLFIYIYFFGYKTKVKTRREEKYKLACNTRMRLEKKLEKRSNRKTGTPSTFEL